MHPFIKTFLYLTACGMSGLSACASLPESSPVLITPKAHAVKFEDKQGPVSAKKGASIIETIKSEAGSSDILQKHLALEEAINRDSPLVLGNRLVLLQDGPATYKAMFAAIRAAQDHINLETYIFEDGEIGTQFADLLLEKQASGVQVNIIYDSVGCLNTPEEFFERLSAGGIQLLEYNPVNPAKENQKEWLLNNRDHRKLLVVDGKVAFLGGINISESYSAGSGGHFSRSRSKKTTKKEVGWRDTHLQIQGPAVAEFQKYFMETWTDQKGPALATRHYFPELDTKGDEIVRAIGSKSDVPESPIYLTLLSAI